jgi:hypothetical protein
MSKEELEEFREQDIEKYNLLCVCDDCGEDYNACVCKEEKDE